MDIKMRNYKRTRGYKNVRVWVKQVGKRTDRHRKHKVDYKKLG